RIAKMDIKDLCKRVFTEDEANYIISKKNPVYTAAGIFAAKEAVVKALGTGFVSDVTYKDIEICHNTQGAPFVLLKNKAKAILLDKGEEIFVSISHDGNYAVAFAMIK
ncbi:MAG: holo-ACP synthase, partial [Clostridia bacterium]|nr:holo-ACP synthase [Clostridia bacterium]